MIILPTSSSSLATRLGSVLPPWFSDLANDPALTGFLEGLGSMFGSTLELLNYVFNAQRIATAQGNMLDLIAQDFFGTRIGRNQLETDTAFALRIQQEILRSRDTRSAISLAVQQLTGQVPTIIEPFNPGDAGAWNDSYFGYAFYGSLQYDPCFLIQVTGIAPSVPPVAGVSGWYDTASGTPGMPGGYDQGATAYVPDEVPGTNSSLFGISELYDVINQTRAAGVTAWVQLS